MKLTTTIKAEAVAAALGKLTGARPVVHDVGGRAVIRWRDEDLPVARAWLDTQLSKGGGAPADVSVDLVPVVTPYAARTVLPVVLGVLLVGYIMGRV